MKYHKSQFLFDFGHEGVNIGKCLRELTRNPPVFWRGYPKLQETAKKKTSYDKTRFNRTLDWTLNYVIRFFPFGTPHTFSDVTPWLCMLYAHLWYFWIQHNSIFQSSHDMCLYDNLWPSNYKVTENNLKIYSFLASPPILGMCFKVSIHYIHQDIHFNLLPRGKVTS